MILPPLLKSQESLKEHSLSGTWVFLCVPRNFLSSTLNLFCKALKTRSIHGRQSIYPLQEEKVLVKTVIACITNFWCSAFVLLKECIKQIDSMCGAYLWKGSLEGCYMTKVSWESVTPPKIEGGLGLKNLEIWNTTCTIKLFWLLLFRTESIWVA